jgi:hypothetical protein
MNRSLNNWVDCVVRANDGDVGKVEQFYFDDLTWTIRYMVVSTGGRRPGRNILISLAALGKPDWEKRVFPVNLTLAQVHSSPHTDIDEPLSRQHEAELHKHYAWPVYWGGGFYVTPGYGMATIPASAAETAAQASSSGVRRVDPHLRSTREVTGCAVRATDGDIGHVEDFLVDDETWVIRYLLVNTRNWLPDRRVLVSPRWIGRISWADKAVSVDLSRAAVKKSPKFDPSKPVSLDYEVKLLGHLRKPEVAEWVLFKFHARSEANVHVAGTFNNWDPAAIKLGLNSSGIYTALVLLPLGRYEYKFIVNGDWRNSPDCKEQVPNAFGTTNSVLVVGHTAAHSGHLHTFSRLPADQDRLTWSTPMGG